MNRVLDEPSYESSSPKIVYDDELVDKFEKIKSLLILMRNMSMLSKMIMWRVKIYMKMII